jgi:hypothetical protein
VVVVAPLAYVNVAGAKAQRRFDGSLLVLEASAGQVHMQPTRANLLGGGGDEAEPDLQLVGISINSSRTGQRSCNRMDSSSGYCPAMIAGDGLELSERHGDPIDAPELGPSVRCGLQNAYKPRSGKQPVLMFVGDKRGLDIEVDQ